MKVKVLSLAFLCLPFLIGGCATRKTSDKTSDLSVADSLLTNILSLYNVEKHGLLSETYPVNPDNQVTYLAEGSEQKKGQEVSFLWPYSGMLSGCVSLYKTTGNQKYKEILEKQIQCPVILENNVKAFAEAEMLYGVGKYGNNIVFIKWGPGVGSAIVVDNKLYEGNQHNAAEIGHYIIEPDGLKCRCGRHGCLETRVSMFALCDRIKEIYSKENTPVLYEETAGDKNLITRELLTSWVENEGNGYITRMDKTISEILVGAIERMARVAVNVLTILAPDCTIVFGSMFENTSIYKLFIQYCTKYDENYTDKLISRSHLSDKMAYIGGTALIASTYFFESKNL